jgi:hypothetical protein
MPAASRGGRFLWGAPVAEGALRTVDGRHPLARVRNRSKFGRGGHEARWLSLTHLGSRLCTAAFETIGFGEERRRGAREIVQVMNFAPSMTLGEASAPKPQPKVQRWNSSAAF